MRQLSRWQAMSSAKTILIQQASGFHTQLLDLSTKAHQAYAARHQLTFWSVRGDVQFERSPVWNKVLLIQIALRMNFELVVWLDADTLVVRPDQDLRRALSGNPPIGMCRHPLSWRRQRWHFNAGVIVVRNTALSREFFDRVWNDGPVSHPWEEQERMNELSKALPRAVQRLDDTWNSTESVNDSADPVIRAWHGKGKAAFGLMKAELPVHPTEQPGPCGDCPRLKTAFDHLTRNMFDYHRVGHDHRSMSFLPDGHVGNGADRSELFWKLREKEGRVLLEISSEDELTCRLAEDRSGTWRGRWLHYERMPVVLSVISKADAGPPRRAAAKDPLRAPSRHKSRSLPAGLTGCANIAPGAAGAVAHP